MVLAKLIPDTDHYHDYNFNSLSVAQWIEQLPSKQLVARSNRAGEAK
jgi:hypothetical protein